MIKGVSGISDVSSKVVVPVSKMDTGDTNLTNSEVKSSLPAGSKEKIYPNVIEFNSDQDGKETGADKGKKLTEENVEEMSGALNDFMKKMNYDIEFSYYKDLDRLIMKVVDKKTDETIRQMPPEDMLKTLSSLREWIGVLLDKKA